VSEALRKIQEEVLNITEPAQSSIARVSNISKAEVRFKSLNYPALFPQ
jgi:hypothetical protein